MRLRPRALFFALHLGGFLLAAALPGLTVEPAVREVISPFDFKGVTLEDGFLRRQIEDARRYYLAIAEDDLLKPYRERAGLPAPGQVLGGWYRENRFNVFGQVVSGLARVHAATGDTGCRDKANRLVEEWAKCLGPDGYFFAKPEPHAPHYIYDKFVWGLLDTHLYCGSTNSLAYLSRITGWAEQHLDRSRPFAPSPEEWYTLSENLYRAWLITGDSRYRTFAAVWEYPQYWDVLADNSDIFQAGAGPGKAPRTNYHAYSHVNCLGGAAMAYRVSGDPKYLATITQGYDFLEACQFFATGGYGPDEQLLPVRELENRIFATHNTFETQCGSWAAFKLTRELMALTGDARYGDWAERLAINGIGVTLPMTPEGHVVYYCDYNPHGGEKRQHPQPWSCCTGTRPQAVAEMSNLAWFHDAQNLYLNLFTPSTLRWTVQGHEVVVKEETRFPEESNVRLLIRPAAPVPFGIRIRIPGWLAAPMSARLNGEPAALEADAKHWAVLKRTWKNGDQVELSLPMAPWAKSLTKVSENPFAVLFGPTVLVCQTTNPAPLGKLRSRQFIDGLRPVPGKPLQFQLAGNEGASIRPFFAVEEAARYHMYLDPSLGTRIHHGDLQYSGAWKDNGPHHVSTSPGASADFEFEGRGLRWIGSYYDDAGRSEVRVDGEVVAVVDQYAPRRGRGFAWTWDKLEPGRHRVRITLLPEANPKSKNRFVNISGIDIIR